MSQRLLLCRIANRKCGIPLEHVLETMRPLPVDSLADSPPYVVGVARIRGMAVPVVDAAALLGESESPRRFVTLRLGSRQVALALGGVEGIREVAAGQLRELPLLLAQGEHVESLGVLDQQLLLVLRSAALIPESLWERLQS